ncbi:hypothetical protein PMIN07_009448 [Paraphaeosphaeria minitans]
MLRNQPSIPAISTPITPITPPPIPPMIPFPFPAHPFHSPPIHARTRAPQNQQQTRNPSIPQPRSRQDARTNEQVFRAEKNHDGVHDVRVSGRCWRGEAERWACGARIEGVGCAEAEEDCTEKGGEDTEKFWWGAGGGHGGCGVGLG